MSEPNFLDVDALEPPLARSIRFLDKTHFVKPITVEAWLENLKDVRELQAFSESAEATPDAFARKNLEVTARSLHRTFPTIPVETFMEMELHKLDAIVKFVRATDGSAQVEGAIKAEAVAENPQQPSMTA